MAALLRRYLAGQVRTDLERKMVFVSGPRQVGKTTMARGLLPDPAGYLSWDIPDHRDAILRGRLPNAPMLVFDELHKFHGWRGFLKGIYDRQDGTRILVTGSGRLDYYRYGGDSLQGRYHLLRLHPLSVAELDVDDAAGLHRLLDLGGFPEPWVSESMGRGAALVARVPHAPRRGGGARPGGGRGRQRGRAARGSADRSGGIAAVGERAARGPAGQPRLGEPLAGDSRAALRHRPRQAVRRAGGPGCQEGAEALPLRLDPGARPGGPASRTSWRCTC